MMKNFLCILLFTAFFSLQAARAGEVIPDGLGHYGVELDVLFTYEPEDDNLERWKSVFRIANNDIHRASSGEVYLQKINLIICPFEIEEGKTKSSADIVIRRTDNPNDRGKSVGTLSGTRPGGVVFFDKGRPVDEDAEAMSHELAHYFFEIYDEYKKPGNLDTLQIMYKYQQLGPTASNLAAFFNNLAAEGVITLFDYDEDEGARLGALFQTPLAATVSNNLASPTATTRLNFRQFCSAPLDELPTEQNNHRACIMDAGSRFQGGLVKQDYYGLLCNEVNHSSGVATKKEDEQVVLWSRNGQSYTTGKSCATVAKEVWVKYHKGSLKLPGTAVNTSAPEVEFEEKTNCSETVVLLLDKSGSMSGARIANLKAAAMGLIDSLDDNTKLGIVWFDSQPQAAVGIQELKDNRSLAKQAIAPIEASGGTNIGFGLGVAYQQLVLLRDPDMERPDETIYLITDGISSDDPTTVVETIRNDGVTIDSVSIGSSTDLSFLQEAAQLTGGTFYFSPDDEDIVRVVTQGATEGLEGYTLVSEESLDPLPSELPITIDSFTGKMLLQLELKNIDTNGLSEADFSLLGPSGQNANATVRFAALSAESALVTFVLADPAEGEHKVQLPTASLTPTSTGRTLLLVQSNEVRLFAGSSPSDAVEYPEPILIKAGVEGNVGSAHNLNITATVRRPDGSEVELQLSDDGSVSAGDDLANDGVYAASFSRYTEDGTYSVEIVADNSNNQAVIGGGMHGPVTEEKFGTFVLQKSLTFEVTDYSTPQTNTLTLSEAEGQSQRQLFSSRLLPQGAVVIANFHAQTGAGQGVVVEQLDLTLSTDLVNLANFEIFEIYVDSDKDGMIDFVGDYARPLGRIRTSVEGGKVSLTDVVTLPANADFDLLVVGYYAAEISVSQDTPEPLNAGWPLSALALSAALALVAKKRRTIQVSLALGVVSLIVLGCGSGDNFVFTNTGESAQNPPVTLPTQTGEVNGKLSLDSVRAVGQIDGLPVTVTLPANPLIDGPPITIESQVRE